MDFNILRLLLLSIRQSSYYTRPVAIPNNIIIITVASYSVKSIYSLVPFVEASLKCVCEYLRSIANLSICQCETQCNAYSYVNGCYVLFYVKES